MRRRSRGFGPPARFRLRISGFAPPTPLFTTNLFEKPETRFRKALMDSQKQPHKACALACPIRVVELAFGAGTLPPPRKRGLCRADVSTLRGQTVKRIGGRSTQKKKVPSDLSLSLTPRRHARHGAAQSRAPDASPVRSPTGAFFAGWINASRHAAAFLFSLSWDRLLETAFHSPATKPAFASSIPGSTFPACSFASCTSVPEPVRLFAPLPVYGSPRSGRFFA